MPALAPGTGPGDYIEGARPVAIAPELTVADADSTMLAARPRIIDGFAASEDALSVTAANGITGEQAATR